MFDDDIDHSKLTKEELVAAITAMKKDVLRYNKPQSSDLHPTMKPLEILKELMLNGSRKEMIVYDPFGGSGSTLIAAEQLGRKCRMIEFEPAYCSVIIERWEKLTGLKAKKEQQ